MSRPPVAFLTLFVFLLFGTGQLSARTVPTAVALPFANQTELENLDWIGESIAETMREVLGSEGVPMLDRTARDAAYERLSLPLRATLTQASVFRIAQESGAQAAFYGSYRLTSDEFDPLETSSVTVEISGRIIYPERGVRSHEIQVQGTMTDLAALQLRLAWAFLKEIDSEATTETAFFNAHKPVRLDAVESYIRGLLAKTPEQKHRLFAQAARLEPTYGGPNYELGILAWNRKGYRTAAGWFEHVPETSGRYAEAQFLLGISLYRLADYRAGLEALEKLPPQVRQTAEVQNNLGAFESRLKQPAVEQFRRAAEADPEDADYRFNLGYALWKQGSFAGATEQFQEVLRLNPKDTEAALLLDRSRKKSGPRPADSRSEGLERLKDRFPRISAGVRADSGAVPAYSPQGTVK